MIRFDHVTKTYEGQRRAALSEIDVEIAKGEFVFLVGASGSGKSTFLRLILREQRPTKGKVFVAGREVDKLATWKIPAMRRQIGTVFQDFRLLPNKTVTENVAFALQVIGKPASTIKRVVPEVLELVGLEGKEAAPRRALRRRTAEGGDRQSLREPANDSHRRRTHWKPRPGDQRGNHEASRPHQSCGHHRADGHARLHDRRSDAQAGDRTRRRIRRRDQTRGVYGYQ